MSTVGPEKGELILGQAHGMAKKGARTGQVAELGHDPPLTTSPCVLAVLTTPHPAAKLKCPQTRLPIAQAVTSRLDWLPVSMLPPWVDQFQKCPRLFPPPRKHSLCNGTLRLLPQRSGAYVFTPGIRAGLLTCGPKEVLQVVVNQLQVRFSTGLAQFHFLPWNPA